MGVAFSYPVFTLVTIRIAGKPFGLRLKCPDARGGPRVICSSFMSLIVLCLRLCAPRRFRSANATRDTGCCRWVSFARSYS